MAIVAIYPAVAAYAPRASEILLCVLGLLALGVALDSGRIAARTQRWLAGFRSPLGFAGAAALGWVLASVVWSPEVGVAVKAAECAGLILLGTLVWPEITAQPLLLFPALAASTALGLILITVEILSGGVVLRPSSLFGDSHLNTAMATMSLFVWPGMAGLVLIQQRALALVLWIVAAAAIIDSPSGASLAGFLVGSAAFVLAWRWPRPSVILMTGMATLGLLLAPLIGGIGRSLPLELSPSLADRVRYWTMYGSLVRERPIFGWGFDAGKFLGTAANRVGVAPALEPGLYVYHPHNVPLQIWLEFGLVGALLAAVLIVLTGRVALRLPKPVLPFVLASATAVYAEAYGSYGLWETWWLASYVLVVLVLSRLGRGYLPRQTDLLGPEVRNEYNLR